MYYEIWSTFWNGERLSKIIDRSLTHLWQLICNLQTYRGVFPPECARVFTGDVEAGDIQG